MHTLTFSIRSLIRSSPAEVFAFHERPDAIELLTPRWQPMRVLRRQGGLETGAEVEFRVWMGPVPVRWLARHVECVPNAYFVDEQVYGPFACWRHEHRFEPAAEGTLLVDDVEFRLPGAPFAHWLLGWAVKLQLSLMFRHRHAVTRQWCERENPDAA